MPKPMDNFKVEVISYGDDHLEAAICICLDEKDTVDAWSINPECPDKLWLFQWVLEGYKKHEFNRFPCPMDRRAVIEFVKGWLRGQDYGGKPDHDGSNSKGFLLTNGSERGWTSNYGVILTVEPCWAMHGK
jgi:hypothetical protein